MIRDGVFRSPLAAFHDDERLPCRQADVDPDIFFPVSSRASAADTIKATRLCEWCPRRTECLLWAYRSGADQHGILGGYTFEERQAHLARKAPRPQRPERAEAPFAWPSRYPPNPERLAHLFQAAHAYILREERDAVAAEFEVAPNTLVEAAAVLRWAPDLEDDVTNGWVSLGAAARHAYAVRKWLRNTEQAAS